MKPSVGHVVHYVSFGTPGGEYKSECRAAVITEAVPIAMGSIEIGVSLAVLNPAGMFFNRNVRQDEDGHAGGTWHWSEREEGGGTVALNLQPVDLSPAQVQQVVVKVQAAILQQAKRSRRPGPA